MASLPNTESGRVPVITTVVVLAVAAALLVFSLLP
jgi:hypothetical protein